MIDVSVDFSGGSLVMIKPLTDAAREWIAQNVSDEQTWFGDRLAVEPRYFDDLFHGMTMDGLEVGDANH